MIIRSGQVEALQAAARASFENEMTAHLAGFSPPLFKAAGEDQIRKVIRLGMARSADYGFDSRGPVRLYLEMMLLFGSDFDTDPQYTWSAEILTRREVGTEKERAKFLYQRTMHYREYVAGPEDEYTLQALRRIQVWSQQPFLLSGGDRVPATVNAIHHIYPQKADYVGQDALETLIEHGELEAHKHEFVTSREITLIVILMLAFGHGCISDPLYPWISRSLEDPMITNVAARGKRLETKSLTWLNRVLANFAQGLEA